MKLLIFLLLSAVVIAVNCQHDAEPSPEYLPPVSDDSSAALTENGYKYRTIRRLKYRHRRDVPNVEYLPPLNNEAPADTPKAPDSALLSDNGYRYRSVKKLTFRYRHRRDVSDTPNSDYLPPAEENNDESPVASNDVPVLESTRSTPEPEPAHNLNKNGYEYKTVRRIRYRYRHRRSIENESVPNSEYLPPVEYLPPLSNSGDTSAPAHSLNNDGYRYRTAKRYRFRLRRN